MSSKQLYFKTLSIKKLSDSDKETMWLLFEKYYLDIDKKRFLQDLNQKDHAIVLFDTGNGAIQGFSTLQRDCGVFNGRPYVAVFTGDTILDKKYWGSSALSIPFCSYLFKTVLSNPFKDVYWHLISKGYKTYLTMTRNTLCYWPRYDVATPPEILQLMDKLNHERFGECWNPDSGVIRFTHPLGKLRESVAPIHAEHLTTPEIRFFNDMNPYHYEGDELACLAKVDIKTVEFCIRRSLVKSVKTIGSAIKGLWQPIS